MKKRCAFGKYTTKCAECGAGSRNKTVPPYVLSKNAHSVIIEKSLLAIYLRRTLCVKQTGVPCLRQHGGGKHSLGGFGRKLCALLLLAAAQSAVCAAPKAGAKRPYYYDDYDRIEEEIDRLEAEMERLGEEMAQAIQAQSQAKNYNEADRLAKQYMQKYEQLGAELEAYEDAYNSGIVQEPVTSSDGFSYILNRDEQSYCVSYVQRMGRTSIAVPASYNGKPVTVIGRGAFADPSTHRGLESVTIPDGVTRIGNNAFLWCEWLKNVTIPDSITQIDAGAFDGCNQLQNITIPAGVTKIGWYAFSRCMSFTRITIPKGVTEIADHTFADCISLASVTILGNVTKIGERAFEGCKSLAHITIPESVTEIGTQAFAGCGSLTSVTIPKGVRFIEFGVFEGCTSLTRVTIPNSVVTITSNAFDGCSSLTEIQFTGTKKELMALVEIKQPDIRNGWQRILDTYTIKCTDGTLGKNSR